MAQPRHVREPQPSGEPATTVVGLGLGPESGAHLVAAFPGCELLTADAAGLAKAQAPGVRPVTVFVDVPLSGELAVRASLIFPCKGFKTIGLCGHCTPAIYDAVLALGFAGALPLDADPATYRRAAASVQRGELWVSREHLSLLMRQHLSASARLALTEREIAILGLILEERSNQQIADRLFVSRETVRWHLKALYAKLGVSDRETARAFARNLLHAA